MKRRFFSLPVIALFLLVFGSCSHGEDTAPKKTFVLVHGAWQASWVWDKVKSQLEQKGQHVLVVELPAHGDDQTSPATVSIDAYRDKVIEAMNKVQGKVILVGHSMGGMVVSAVAEKIPGSIEKLIFIGAFVPADGQSLLDLATTDHQSQLGASLIPSADQLTLDVKHENIISIFCADAAQADQDLMLQKYRVEPAIPFTNKAQLTPTGFGRVDKYYIHTLQDHAIGMDLQNQMVTAAGITKTYSINSSHSPFLSQPDEVTKLLLTIAAR